MVELNPVIETDIESTSTIALARALFQASWKWNVGRKVDDTLTWDGLTEIAKFHLLEVAFAAETLLEKYDTEPYKLLLGNLAIVIYEAYHKHPISTVPNLPFDTAPDDVKRLWIEYARTVLDAWYLSKQLPRHRGWLQVTVKPE